MEKRGFVVKVLLFISIFSLLILISNSTAQETTETTPTATEQIPTETQPTQTEQPPTETQQETIEQPGEEEITQEEIQEEPAEHEEPVPVEVPEGCRAITDETGNSRIECEAHERECPSPSLPEDLKQKCLDSGGQEVTENFPGGCPEVRCSYSSDQGFGSSCPLQIEFERVEQRCRDHGLDFVINRNLGCDVPRCAPSREKACPEVPFEEIRKAKEECGKSNGRLIREFDEKGCAKPRCVTRDIGPSGVPGREGQFGCRKEVPKEAYDRCTKEGGNLIVKTGQEGCIHFAKCVKRGSNDIEFDRVKEIPSSTKLIRIALELEKLKIELDKLARQSASLAEYYEDKNDQANIEKFNRVATMFESAKGRIDDIGEELRGKARSLTLSDVNQFKSDLAYIEDVVLQDIAFVMLGGEPVGKSKFREEKEFDKVSGGNCGDDEDCFDAAFRICQPASMNPPGPPNGQITVTIIGLEEKTCVVHAEGTFFGKSADMECKFDDYAFVETNDENIIKHCKGEMVEFMKQQFRNFEGPGNCKSERECNNYCENPENMRECLRFAKEQGFTEHLPPPEIQRAIEEGTFTGGPGNCKGPRECDVYCSNPENSQECIEFAKKYGLAEHIPDSERFRSPQDFGLNQEEFNREFSGDFSGPGGCRSPEECQEYCSRAENYGECSSQGPGPDSYGGEFGGEFGPSPGPEEFGFPEIVGQVIKNIGDFFRR